MCVNFTSQIEKKFKNVSLTSGELFAVALIQVQIFETKAQTLRSDISTNE